jgi:hypothetical protein
MRFLLGVTAQRDVFPLGTMSRTTPTFDCLFAKEMSVIPLSRQGDPRIREEVRRGTLEQKLYVWLAMLPSEVEVEGQHTLCLCRMKIVYQPRGWTFARRIHTHVRTVPQSNSLLVRIV